MFVLLLIRCDVDTRYTQIQLLIFAIFSCISFVSLTQNTNCFPYFHKNLFISASKHTSQTFFCIQNKTMFFTDIATFAVLFYLLRRSLTRCLFSAHNTLSDPFRWIDVPIQIVVKSELHWLSQICQALVIFYWKRCFFRRELLILHLSKSQTNGREKKTITNFTTQCTCYRFMLRHSTECCGCVSATIDTVKNPKFMDCVCIVLNWVFGCNGANAHQHSVL